MIKNKAFLIFLTVIFTHSLMANDLPIKITQKLNADNRAALETALEMVEKLLPQKLKLGLPADVELRFEKLSEDQFLPVDACSLTNKNYNSDKKNQINKPFVYGEYSKRNNKLVLNLALLNEFAIGSEKSKKINCQHKSLYDQAIATIIHELTHAYDFNNGRISGTSEFINRAGFQKGLLKIKNKNINPMRSADPYELTNIAEAYAVNMEYFLMDSEYACRKPAMFEYFKRTLETDPFPNRKCQQNFVVMMSTAGGYFPVSLDPQRIYRIDYLLASPGKELSSGFGHSMFRIVVCAPEHYDVMTKKLIKATPYGPKCLEDRLFHLVVSYRANVEDATLNYFKGVFGGYPSMLFILNFSDVLDEYNRDELRDIVSYPLKLSVKDKVDFVNKVLEDHWNYRGSYKFVTNNCAVESYGLLKSALDNSVFQGLRPLTPNGVLEDLDQLEFLSLKSNSEETFKARTEQLIKSYHVAYEDKSLTFSNDKKVVINFIHNSSSVDRLQKYKDFTQTSINSLDLHTELTLIKNSLIKASSFSVLEQQILRTKYAEFRKKVAEYIINSKDEKIKNLISESESAFKLNFSDLATTGYGVPLSDELLHRQEIDLKRVQSKESVIAIETLLREVMPKEIAALDLINSNVEVFNRKSIEIRKVYREKLDLYIHQVLTNLSYDDNNRSLLYSALTSDESIAKVRDLLDPNLVSNKEILDVKLRKLIEETLN